MANKIYRVAYNGPDATEHLVSASNQAQALRAVAKDTYSVAMASQEDMYRLAKAGVEIIEAGADKEGEQE